MLNAENMWDLRDLYEGDVVQEIQEDLDSIKNKALMFSDCYKHNLHDCFRDVNRFRKAIAEYEKIQEMGMRPSLFAHLYRAADNLDTFRESLSGRLLEKWEEISGIVLFFPLQIKALSEDVLTELAQNSALKPYKQFLLRLRKDKPFDLSEPEEQAIRMKGVSTKTALLALYDNTISSLPVSISKGEGQDRSFSPNQVQGMLNSPDRNDREAVFAAFLSSLKSNGTLFQNILVSLTMNSKKESQHRGLPSSAHRSYLSNGVDETVIRTLLVAVREKYPLAGKYFRLKARAMGLKKLRYTDLLAPVGKEGRAVEFSRAKEIVTETAEKLGGCFSSTVITAFENGWIDWKIRAGKQYGAFCNCFSPSQHPYILMNYEGNAMALMTLAHELGHAVHYRVASEQSYLNFNPPPVLAETASNFMEGAAIMTLAGASEEKKTRLSFVAVYLDRIFLNLFRQHVFTSFEYAMYQNSSQGNLSEEEICSLWWKVNERLYGDTVEMPADYCWAWASVPHFFHLPFYCYSYIFGNLLSLTLLERMQEHGPSFMESIIKMLAAGGSRDTVELLASIGVNPTEGLVWKQAFRSIEKQIELFEGLLSASE